ncbi:MAG: 3-hydroxyacyl-CoA dehydrogenase, partial [Candidatus Eremiobacteraeota bacterium]|nr:3-hydroxyacyl-CoA dehydrogenase [Candidatus Eremiobacteraeota bacterium]
WRIRKRRNAEKPPEGRYSTLQDRLCELGRFGQKTGAGFYKYIDGRTPMADPAVEQLIAEHAKSQGIAQRVIGDDEIRKRCIYPLINEAAKILAEGIAQRPGDVDVVWVYGYGFPIWRGGPLRYADATGIRTIYEEMLAFERVHGTHWTPAPLLAELATTGGEFAHWKGAQWAIPR